MSMRMDVDILISDFQRFDDGGQVTEEVPASWDLEEGDTTFWNHAQFDGIAEVISCSPAGTDKMSCVLEKVS